MKTFNALYNDVRIYGSQDPTFIENITAPGIRDALKQAKALHQGHVLLAIREERHGWVNVRDIK